MDERNFRIWMEALKEYHTARTYAARCHRVEIEMNIDLDEQFRKDNGTSLMTSLKYSKKEFRDGIRPSCGIHFEDGANMYSGMHSLRASVKKYFDFKQAEVDMEINGGSDL
ncbi:MAG: hypothetical protein PUE12_12880 [Oscillospiraceae bacterium]|nr:hypothetical protein [Oscillospiraceae bacterium]